MVDFKVVLSDPQTGLSYKMEATGGMAGALIGKNVGEEISGDALGLTGYTIAITGASDKTGIPARRDLPGTARRHILLSESTGFHASYDGQRCRKTIRSSEITQDFVQINAKVTQYGEKDLKSIFATEAAPAEE